MHAYEILWNFHLNSNEPLKKMKMEIKSKIRLGYPVDVEQVEQLKKKKSKKMIHSVECNTHRV